MENAYPKHNPIYKGFPALSRKFTRSLKKNTNFSWLYQKLFVPLQKKKQTNRSLTIWLASSVGRALHFHISKSALNENLRVELP